MREASPEAVTAASLGTAPTSCPDEPYPIRWCRRGLGFALETEKLHIKHKHATGPPHAAGSIGQISWDPESPFLADHHELQALGPALDDSVQREGDGLAPYNAAVEHLFAKTKGGQNSKLDATCIALCMTAIRTDLV
eukprot:1183522-Prorocentrum_minimum.AAC.4